MNVTRDVIKDLLPLYAAGEASADTRALVGSFLSGDPELLRLAEALKAGEVAPEPALPQEAGREALRRTRRLLRRRSWLLGRNLLYYGVGGLIVPFAGIKLIDVVLSVLGLT